MTGSLQLAVPVAALLFVLAAPLIGFRRWVLMGLLGALCVVPASVWTAASPGAVHYGISPGAPSVMTYHLPLLLLLVTVIGIKEAAASFLPVLLAVVYLLLMMRFAWPEAPYVLSGAMHVVTGLLGFLVGSRVCMVECSPRRVLDFIAVSAAGIMALQAVLVSAQWLGFPLSPHPEAGYFLSEGRMIGSFNHPGLLGKYALILLIPLLPSLRSPSRFVRRLSYIAVGLCVSTSGLTLARANTAAIVAAIVLWIMLDRRREKFLVGRLAQVCAVGLLAIPAAAGALARFQNDSGGGERGYLMDVALPYLRDHWLTGIGANSYVPIVGRWDPVTASGYPVHNSLMILLIELGIIGVMIALWPLWITIYRAFRGWRQSGLGGECARAVVAVLPGLALVGGTGWGMAASGVYVTMSTLLGVALALMVMPDATAGETGDCEKTPVAHKSGQSRRVVRVVA